MHTEIHMRGTNISQKASVAGRVVRTHRHRCAARVGWKEADSTCIIPVPTMGPPEHGGSIHRFAEVHIRKQIL